MVTKKLGALFAISIALSGCSALETKKSFTGPEYCILGSSIDVLKQKKLFYQKEEAVINSRRISNGFQPVKDDLIGLAMSGGGIRSYAFQLGVLSGLHAAGQLSRIDYISAVSGGSWAAGAYKTTNKSDDAFFLELDQNAKSYSTSDEDPKLINTYASVLPEMEKSNRWTDFFNLYVGYSGREAWRGFIWSKILKQRDLKLDEMESDPLAKTRPALIINATQNAKFNLLYTEKYRMKKSVPFEFTGFHSGTSADCGTSPGYCAMFGDEKTNGFYVWSPGYDKKKMRLSQALAISGAVMPPYLLGVRLKLMEWDYRGADKIPAEYNLRKNYVLSDGGHSENLGALALISRGVKLIVILDAAYDPEGKKTDMEVLQHHAKTLYGKHIKLNIKKADYASVGSYTDSDGNEEGKILYIQMKDTTSFRDFLRYQTDCDILANYLDQGNQWFPMDKTFVVGYQSNLQKSYYMLGKFIAQNYVSQYVNKHSHLSSEEFEDHVITVANSEVVTPPFPDKGTQIALAKLEDDPHDVRSISQKLDILRQELEAVKLHVKRGASEEKGGGSETGTDYCTNFSLRRTTCRQVGPRQYSFSIGFKSSEWENVDLEKDLREIAQRLSNEKDVRMRISAHASAADFACDNFKKFRTHDLPKGLRVEALKPKGILATYTTSAQVIETTCRDTNGTNEGNRMLSLFRLAWLREVLTSTAKNFIDPPTIDYFGDMYSGPGDHDGDRVCVLDISLSDKVHK